MEEEETLGKKSQGVCVRRKSHLVGTKTKREQMADNCDDGDSRGGGGRGSGQDHSWGSTKVRGGVERGGKIRIF